MNKRYVRECVRCKNRKEIVGRGLCGACWAWVKNHNELENYSVRKAGDNIRIDICIDCGNEEHIFGRDRCEKCYKKWYFSQPEIKKRHAEEMKRYRKEKPEIYRAIEDRRSQTEKRIEYEKKHRKEYYQKNVEKLCAYQVEWRKENRELYRSYMRIALARRRCADGYITHKQWEAIVSYYCPDNKCPCCGQDFDLKDRLRWLSIDHVIPINLGGSNWPSNIQPLCLSCNSSKKYVCTDYRFDKGAFAKSLENDQSIYQSNS